jgi:hypothetical protein
MRFLAGAVSWMVALGAVFVAAGCASDSQASKQAGKGAALGGVGGTVAGAVAGLLSGGNVVQGAVKGGIAGAASGAAVGGVAGSMADNQNKQNAGTKPPPKTPDSEAKMAQLRQQIGDRNYATTLLVAQCRHRDAIASAQDTLAATQDPKERAYAMLIQGIAAEESGDKALAASIYPKIVQEDPSRGSVDKVRADALEGVMKVQTIRKDHGLAPVCT